MKETGMVRMLLVEDSPADARYVIETLRVSGGPGTPAWHVEWADRLQSGLTRLAAHGADVVVLDLCLPDARGLDTVARMRALSPDVAIVVLTGQTDEQLGIRALQLGAQEYIVKGDMNGHGLQRAAMHAIERARMDAELRGLTLADELTGLLNRRGFLDQAHRRLRWAQRSGRGCSLLFADLDGLKRINDTWGHAEGDRALRAAAAVLKEAFGGEDVLARIGGDEFAVLTTSSRSDSVESVASRLDAGIARANTGEGHPWRLSLSLGMARVDHGGDKTLQGLMAEADAAMYRIKAARTARDERNAAPGRPQAEAPPDP